MKDFATEQVVDLKSYLKSRGISPYLYLKNDLMGVHQLAKELQLENIDSESDYQNSFLVKL